MAQPGEFAWNPLPPGTASPPPAGDYATAKRRRDECDDSALAYTANENETSAPKRRHTGQDIIFRIVVPSREIGKVIGIEGSRIQKIREATKANIKIADAIARHEDRVIIISSKESENPVSDAEKALQHIAALILKEDQSNGEVSKVVGGGHVGPNAMRLLLAGSQAGYLIGMHGQNIEKLRNSSGATIIVFEPKQLPSCASALESDRIVQISGDVTAVLKALQDIGCQLRGNPPKEVISISPSYNYTTALRMPQPYVDPTSGYPMATSYTAAYVTFEMIVAEAYVGGLIGRSGSNISRIRNETGAMVKVHGGKGAQKHRHVHFAGTAQQVAMAKQMVDENIYAQVVQQASAQQQAYDEAQTSAPVSIIAQLGRAAFCLKMREIERVSLTPPTSNSSFV